MELSLSELLDKIYELEGLVHLALKREDASSAFIRLISQKGKEIGDICANLGISQNIGSQSPEQSLFSDGPDSQNNKESEVPFDDYFIDDELTAKEALSLPQLESFDSISNSNEKIESKPLQKGKLVFSINERFRFKKELFNNSDIDFNNTLALVASMESYEEAEDYFINDEGFNKEDAIVMEFLNVVNRYFK